MFIVEPIKCALYLGGSTILFSLLLDNTICKKTTMNYWKTNPELYMQGLMANYTNLIFLSPLNYVVAYNKFLNIEMHEIEYTKLMIILFIHNVLYYCFHYGMHKNKVLKKFHDFHHKFKITTSTSGNAVSVNEFLFAYVSPFIVGSILTYPTRETFDVSILIISFLNSIIHVNEFKNLSWPSYLVSPGHPINHNDSYEHTYSAPLVNLDYLLDYKKD